MRNSCFHLIRAAVLFAAVSGLTGAENSDAIRDLEAGFANPPREARPWTLWQWMNGNISREGITADLAAFKKAGLAGAQSFHLDYGLPQGPVEFLSPEWLDLYLFAAQEADRLGLEIGTHNGGGWSTSGGPWIVPENGMQVLVTTGTRARGPATFDAVLPLPAPYLPAPAQNPYRDIAVLAYPTPPGDRITMGMVPPVVTITAGKGARQPGIAGDFLTDFALPPSKTNAPSSVRLEFSQPFTARQLILTPAKDQAGFKGVLESSDDGVTFSKIRTIQVWDQPHRQNYPYQQAFPIPETTARFFRLTIDPGSDKPTQIAEAGLSGRLTVEDLPGKAFFQRHFIPELPEKAATPETGAVAKHDIVDLTGKMDADGRLRWEVPPGDWTIVRIGFQPNGQRNHPAPRGGEGLECDKLSKSAVDAHWAGMMGKLIEKFGPLAGKSFTKVEIDSWEVGTQNWTPKFREEFARRRGYDLGPFLPVFTGQTVESMEVTERFLWDFRRTIADLFAENYAAHMRSLANEHGLKLAAENYGTGPFDDLQYGGMVDIPMGVHWMHNGSPQSCTTMAVSSAHTYGHKVIASEAFTAGETGGNRWDTDPYAMKRLGDLMYCQGVNRFIFHAGTLQRWPGRAPGLTFGKVGSQLSRTVTWWDNGGMAWFRYLARCQWMLQQGLPVVDVCVLAGEGAPPPTYGGSVFPKVPPGYKFDLCSTDAFLSRMSVRDGRLVMPDGMSYRMLMLPDATTMTLPVLRKIQKLADAGATIIGPKPTRSPSLVGFPESDEEIRQLAAQLWRPELADGRGVSAQSCQTACAALKLKPDFEALGGQPQIAFEHRSTPEAEIYFVSNQKYFPEEVDAAFRVTGRAPEIWDPDTGEIRKVPLYREEDGRTIFPLRLDPSGSAFVVFRTASSSHWVAAKFLPDHAVPASTLKILRASYGRFDPKGSPRMVDLTATKAGGVKRIMTPERFAEQDPAPGVPKHVLAQYAVEGRIFSQAVPADSVLEFPQLPVRYKTVRVWYGALSAAPSPGDQTVDVTETLNREVRDGKLSVLVRPELAGSAPVPPDPRELRVEYLSNGRWNIAILPDGQRLDLPGDYETGAAPAAYELRALPSGKVELLAWVPGRFEFTTSEGGTMDARIESVPPAREVPGPWRLQFPPNLGAPEEITLERLISWPESDNAGVRYFAGTATYTKELDLPAAWTGPEVSLDLDLGAVKNIAQVTLNGKDLGILWKPPFRVKISGAARAGKNTLEVRVTNLWPNRLIGDENLPSDREWNFKGGLDAWPQWVVDGKPSPTGRIAFTSARHWKKDDPLLPSGLLGPVRLIPAERRILSVRP